MSEATVTFAFFALIAALGVGWVVLVAKFVGNPIKAKTKPRNETETARTGRNLVVAAIHEKNAWEWYLDAWRNFGNFEGRSSRAAYWYFALVHLIISLMCLFLDVAFFRWPYPFLTTLYYLASFFPGLSLSVRRLHDAGRSGWWLLVGVVPVVGQLAVLVFLVSASQPPTEMRLCPFCAEEIKFAAIKCKHCGEFLTEKPNEDTDDE